MFRQKRKPSMSNLNDLIKLVWCKKKMKKKNPFSFTIRKYCSCCFSSAEYTSVLYIHKQKKNRKEPSIGMRYKNIFSCGLKMGLYIIYESEMVG